MNILKHQAKCPECQGLIIKGANDNPDRCEKCGPIKKQAEPVAEAGKVFFKSPNILGSLNIRPKSVFEQKLDARFKTISEEKMLLTENFFLNLLGRAAKNGFGALVKLTSPDLFSFLSQEGMLDDPEIKAAIAADPEFKAFIKFKDEVIDMLASKDPNSVMKRLAGPVAKMQSGAAIQKYRDFIAKFGDDAKNMLANVEKSVSVDIARKLNAGKKHGKANDALAAMRSPQAPGNVGAPNSGDPNKSPNTGNPKASFLNRNSGQKTALQTAVQSPTDPQRTVTKPHEGNKTSPTTSMPTRIGDTALQQLRAKSPQPQQANQTQVTSSVDSLPTAEQTPVSGKPTTKRPGLAPVGSKSYPTSKQSPIDPNSIDPFAPQYRKKGVDTSKSTAVGNDTGDDDVIIPPTNSGQPNKQSGILPEPEEPTSADLPPSRHQYGPEITDKDLPSEKPEGEDRSDIADHMDGDSPPETEKQENPYAKEGYQPEPEHDLTDKIGMIDSREVQLGTGMNETELQTLVAQGKMRAYRSAGTMKFKAEDVKNWMKDAKARRNKPETPAPSDPNFIDAREAMNVADIDESELQTAVARGELRAFRKDGTMKFKPEDLISYKDRKIPRANFQSKMNSKLSPKSNISNIFPPVKRPNNGV